MSFDKWITHIFDHPVTDPAWYWGDNAEYWDCSADTMVDYMTQLFEGAEDVLMPFSDAQVDQGLWWLVSSSGSQYVFALRDEAVPLSSRLICIQSMETLFETCFSKRCSAHLSHLDEAGRSPLNSICYMWWDVIPIHGLTKNAPDRSDSAAIDEACLNVIQKILNMNSIACQESGVLGLLEWGSYYPKIIDNAAAKFLSKYRGRNASKLRPELRAFVHKYVY